MSEPSIPIKMTCPDCQGCINFEIDTHSHIITYRCQVGHTYSLKEIVKGKEGQVENHLWTVIGLFEHLETLYTKLLNEPIDAKTLSDHHKQLILERLACIAQHKQVLLTLAEENAPPPINDGD